MLAALLLPPLRPRLQFQDHFAGAESGMQKVGVDPAYPAAAAVEAALRHCFPDTAPGTLWSYSEQSLQREAQSIWKRQSHGNHLTSSSSEAVAKSGAPPSPRTWLELSQKVVR